MSSTPFDWSRGGQEPPERGDPRGSGFKYPSFKSVGSAIMWVLTALATVFALGGIIPLEVLIMIVVYVMAGMVVICEAIGFTTFEDGRLRFRRDRKRSLRVLHVLRGLGALFVTLSWLLHLSLVMSAVDAAIFVAFRYSHKKHVAPRLMRSEDDRSRNDRAARRRRLDMLGIRRLGVAFVAILAIAIPTLSGPLEFAAHYAKKLSGPHVTEAQSNNGVKESGTNTDGVSASPNERANGNESVASAPSSTPSWDGGCPSEEGATAPRWARAVIRNLYEGNGAPGSLFAGCTGQVHVLKVPRCGSFLWTQGEQPYTHAILSLAVVCKRGGYSTLYLDPAVAPVRALIKEFEEAYSPHDIKADEGNVYPVETGKEGTFILIRTTTGGATAVPYTELPPPVAQAWVGAMREVRAWLWVIETASVAGVKHYLLTENGNPDRILFRVTYRPKGQNYVAERDDFKYWLSENQEVNTAELERAAMNAKS